MEKPSLQFSLRALLLVFVPACVLIGFFFAPVTVRVSVSASLIMNSVHYSEGLRINVYDDEGLIAENSLIVSRKMDVEPIPINLDEVDFEKKFIGDQQTQVPEDNSYLEIRVNLLQKFRIKNAENIRVGGLPLPE